MTTFPHGKTARLFSCGTNPDGVSYLVEWDDSEGATRRMYRGLAENSSDTVHFATSRNKYLAAGDDHVIKFWDMDHDELLMTADAGGGLPVSFLTHVSFPAMPCLTIIKWRIPAFFSLTLLFLFSRRGRKFDSTRTGLYWPWLLLATRLRYWVPSGEINTLQQ